MGTVRAELGEEDDDLCSIFASGVWTVGQAFCWVLAKLCSTAALPRMEEPRMEELPACPWGAERGPGSAPWPAVIGGC